MQPGEAGGGIYFCQRQPMDRAGGRDPDPRCRHPGYLNSPERTASAFGANGWFRTGDIGRLDSDSRLHYIGRSHEIMKVKGINTSSAAAVSLLVHHDLVNDAFVVASATLDGEASRSAR